MGKSNQTFRNMWMGRERQGNLGKSSKPWKHWDLLRYDTGIWERLGNVWENGDVTKHSRQGEDQRIFGSMGICEETQKMRGVKTTFWEQGAVQINVGDMGKSSKPWEHWKISRNLGDMGKSSKPQEPGEVPRTIHGNMDSLWNSRKRRDLRKYRERVDLQQIW